MLDIDRHIQKKALWDSPLSSPRWRKTAVQTSIWYIVETLLNLLSYLSLASLLDCRCYDHHMKMYGKGRAPSLELRSQKRRVAMTRHLHRNCVQEAYRRWAGLCQNVPSQNVFWHQHDTIVGKPITCFRHKIIKNVWDYLQAVLAHNMLHINQVHVRSLHQCISLCVCKYSKV